MPVRGTTRSHATSADQRRRLIIQKRQSRSTMFSNARHFSAKKNRFKNVGRDQRSVRSSVGSVTVNVGRDCPGCTARKRRDTRRRALKLRLRRAAALLPTVHTLGQENLHLGLYPSFVNERTNQTLLSEGVNNPDSDNHERDRAQSTAEDSEDMSNIRISPIHSPRTRDLSCADRYALLLCLKRLGYPLYLPEPDLFLPSQYDTGTRIGDVGILTPDGAFDFLFNICFAPDDPVNPPVVPDGFEVLQLTHVSARNIFSPGASVVSQDVNAWTNGSQMNFDCSGDDGAVLGLPKGAILYEAENKIDFHNYASRHAENWYKYMIEKRGREAINGSLYLVTGCIKTDDTWGIATFERATAPEEALQFVDEEVRTGLSSHRKYSWNSVRGSTTKCGVNSGENVLNQCVFLRGYKIALQGGFWDNLVEPIMAKRNQHQSSYAWPPTSKDGPSGDSSHRKDGCHPCYRGSPSTLSDHANHFTINVDFDANSPIHPSDLINKMLLQKTPKAKVALTHDDDWCAVDPKDSRDWDFRGLLDDIFEMYDCVVDEQECVSLIAKAPSAHPCSQTGKYPISTVFQHSGSPSAHQAIQACSRGSGAVDATFDSSPALELYVTGSNFHCWNYDQYSHVDVHPLLRFSAPNISPLLYDLTGAPSAQLYKQFPVCLEDAATEPPLPRMRIASPGLPWLIDISPASQRTKLASRVPPDDWTAALGLVLGTSPPDGEVGAGAGVGYVTVSDVLLALYNSLHTIAHPSEYERLTRAPQSPTHTKDSVTGAVWARLGRIIDPEEKEEQRRKGVRRIDFAGSNTTFLGLRGTPKSDVWELELGEIPFRALPLPQGETVKNLNAD